MVTQPVSEGQTFTHRRTFSREDVDAFTRLSEDENSIHTEPNEDGSVVVHGLLVGTLPTKIGGELRYIARELNYTFHRPVYTGTEIRCTMTVTSVTERDDGLGVQTEYVCRNDANDRVMSGDSDGVIFDSSR